MVGIHIGSNFQGNRDIAVRLSPEKMQKIDQWVGEVSAKIDLGKLMFI